MTLSPPKWQVVFQYFRDAVALLIFRLISDSRSPFRVMGALKYLGKTSLVAKIRVRIRRFRLFKRVGAMSPSSRNPSGGGNRRIRQPWAKAGMARMQVPTTLQNKTRHALTPIQKGDTNNQKHTKRRNATHDRETQWGFRNRINSIGKT